MHLGRRDREGRHDHDGVADRPEQHATLPGRSRDPAAPAQPVARRRELDPAHQTFEPHFPHRRLRHDAVVQQRAELVGALPHVGEHAPRFDQFEVAQRDRSRERVPAVGMPVVEGPLAEVVAEERAEHGVGGDRHRHRQVPGGHRLAQAQQVGAQSRLLGREQRAGAPEAGGDLVADAAARRASRHAAPSCASPARSASCMPAARLHERLDDHGRELVGVARRRARTRSSKHVGVAEGGCAHDGKAQRVEHVGAEPVVADRRARRSCRRGRRRRTRGTSCAARPGSPSAGTRSSAPARPPTRRRRRTGSAGRSTGTTRASASDSSTTTRLPFPSIVECAPRSSCCRIASSSSGTRCPRVLTQSDEIAVEVAVALDVDQVVALGPVDDDRVVAGERRHLREPVPHDGGVTSDPVVGGHEPRF